MILERLPKTYGYKHMGKYIVTKAVAVAAFINREKSEGKKEARERKIHILMLLNTNSE